MSWRLLVPPPPLQWLCLHSRDGFQIDALQVLPARDGIAHQCENAVFSWALEHIHLARNFAFRACVALLKNYVSGMRAHTTCVEERHVHRTFARANEA